MKNSGQALQPEGRITEVRPNQIKEHASGYNRDPEWRSVVR